MTQALHDGQMNLNGTVTSLTSFTYGQRGCSFLCGLAIVEVKLKQMLRPPIRQQCVVQTEQNRVAAVYTADPDWKPGSLQHTAHL